MSESNATAPAAEVAAPAVVDDEKKETKSETMEVEAAPADAPSDEATTEEDEAPAPEKPKGKAKAAPKKKAAAPKKAAAAAAAPAPATSPKAKAAPAAKKASAPKESSSGSGSHPPYLEMIVAAVEHLKERNGSSRQAILKYITTTYELGVDAKMANVHLKQALKRGVTTGTLKNTKVRKKAHMPSLCIYC